MTKQKILIVDDEEDIREIISFNLAKDGYETITASNGEEALELIDTEKPDLVILDVMLPGIDGNMVCMQVKNNLDSKNTPILMLSAKSDETDQVVGLKMGADDYLTKPFSVKVLSAKVSAVLRRVTAIEDAKKTETVDTDKDEQPTVEYANLVMNPNDFTAKLGLKTLKLTAVEYKILYFLIKKPGRVYSREKILEKVRGDDVIITGRTVDVHILSLRRKLDDYSDIIETVRGIGYKAKEL